MESQACVLREQYQRICADTAVVCRSGADSPHVVRLSGLIGRRRACSRVEKAPVTNAGNHVISVPQVAGRYSCGWICRDIQYEPAHPKDDNDKEKEKEEDIEEANLCVEAGQVAEKCEAWNKAIQLYTKAKGLYEEMEYEEDALRLANRILYAEEMRKEQKQKD